MKLALRPLAGAVLLALSGAASAVPGFVDGLALDGAALDLSGGTSANNGRLGCFSDIYYDPNRQAWWGISDRGPGGGTLSDDTRAQRFALDVDADTGAISNFRVLQPVDFKSGGKGLNGLAPNPTDTLGLAFDPEGLVINPHTGTLLVSDEYGPAVRKFNRSGKLLRTFESPANLVPRNTTTGVANDASDAGNNAGKRTNRGMEGLAISPDGQYAYGIMQSALLDDGGGNGTVSRIVKYELASGTAVAQYAYPMERANEGQGRSALVALNDHEF